MEEQRRRSSGGGAVEVEQRWRSTGGDGSDGARGVVEEPVTAGGGPEGADVGAGGHELQSKGNSRVLVVSVNVFQH